MPDEPTGLEPCTCGHTVEEHDGPNRACAVCECMEYEPDMNEH